MPLVLRGSSFTIGKIPVEVRATFPILPGLVASCGCFLWVPASILGPPGNSGTQLTFAVTFAIALVMGVVAHEGGHVLAGRTFGHQLVAITLKGVGVAVRLRPVIDPIGVPRIAISQAGPIAGGLFGLTLLLLLPPASGGWVAGAMVLGDSALNALVPLSRNSDAAKTYKAAYGMLRRALDRSSAP